MNAKALSADYADGEDRADRSPLVKIRCSSVARFASPLRNLRIICVDPFPAMNRWANLTCPQVAKLIRRLAATVKGAKWTQPRKMHSWARSGSRTWAAGA